MFKKFPILAVLLVSTCVTPAYASPTMYDQSVCGSRADFLEKLSKNYNEVPRHLGLASNGSVLEVVVNSKTRTWTIVVTMPNGTTCMVASGDSWEDVPQIFEEGSGI